MLLAGTRTSPARRRTRSSRILRAPQWGFSRLSATIRLSIWARQLVGVAHRPARAVAQRFEPMLLVAIEDLVAGLAGNAELPADRRSSLRRPAAGPQTAGARPSPNTPSTASTPPARHAGKGVTHVSGTFCHLCLGPLRLSKLSCSIKSLRQFPFLCVPSLRTQHASVKQDQRKGLLGEPPTAKKLSTCSPLGRETKVPFAGSPS